jgi:hypothetical protein
LKLANLKLLLLQLQTCKLKTASAPASNFKLQTSNWKLETGNISPT